MKYDDLVTRKQQLVLQVANAIGLMDDERSRNETELDSAISIVFTLNSQSDRVIASQREVSSTDDVWLREYEKHEVDSVLYNILVMVYKTRILYCLVLLYNIELPNVFATRKLYCYTSHACS